jgi:biotin transport system substrate-specific component
MEPDTPPEQVTTASRRAHAATVSRTRSRELATAGLLAALLAAGAWVTIPIGAVPLTLQTFVVATGTYLLAGAIGLPVFSGAQGGLGVLLGPTGGFLFGFFVGATLGAYVRVSLTRDGARPMMGDVAAAITTLAVVFGLGWLQLTLVTGIGFAAAFITGVAPFVLVDVAKAAAAVVVAGALRRAGVVPGD